ncbi:MAG: hypothetical protein NTW29_13290 [Bacteroidetes bacterium]|nr:hypothetical protein [Bacteroidota bacterium]
MIGYAACRKADAPLTQERGQSAITRFFYERAPATPLVQSIRDYAIREQAKAPFAEALIRQIGYPQWNKALTIAGASPSRSGRGAEDSVHITYVPFVRDSQQHVNATLAVATSPGDTSLRIFCDWQYADTTATGLSKAQFALTMMALDEAVFGNRLYQLTDTTIFHHRSRYIRPHAPGSGATKSLATASSSLLSWLYTTTICWTEYVPLYQGQVVGCDPETDCPFYTAVQACIEIIWSSSGGGGGGGTSGPIGGTGGGGGSGSGGGWVPPNNPNPCGGVASLIETQVGCGVGWVPVGGGGGAYNPYAGAAIFNNSEVSVRDNNKINYWKTNNLDTLGLDSCRMQLLNKLINTLGQSPIGVFLSKLDNAIGIPNTIDKFKIHFLTRPMINYDAITEHAIYDEISKEFEVDIVLDSTRAKTATDIFIVNTLFHEIVHAYMTFIWKKLNQGATQQQMDSLKYDQIFNAYVDTLRIRDSLNPQLAILQMESIQHNYMADRLIEYIANTVKIYDNKPSTNDSYYWYLAWAGLTRKQVRTWKSLWPNFPSWPPTNPATSEADKRGLKYALTLSRIDSIYNVVLENESKGLPGAKGRKPVVGGCY